MTWRRIAGGALLMSGCAVPLLAPQGDPAPLVDAAAPVRWVAYLALLPMTGALVLPMLVRRTVQASHPDLASRIVDRARLAGLLAGMILLSALALKLYFQARSFTEPGEPLTWEGVKPIVLSTSWGHGWAWQFASALGALVAFHLVRRTGRARLALLMAVALSVWSAALTGHATEFPWGARLGVALQGLHVAGGALWLGTLAVFMAAVLTETRAVPEREVVVAAMVHAYSPLALTGAGTAMLAGLLLALGDVGSWGALVSSAYGRTLLIKLAFLGGILCLGFYNWRRLRPSLGAAPGTRRLVRSASAELLLGTALLAATAVLVALPAPGLP